MSSYNIPEDKVTVVYNGVDTQLFEPKETNIRNELNIDDDSFVVFCPDAGVRKGYLLLLKAVAEIHKINPKIHLIVPGFGVDESLQTKSTSYVSLLKHIPFGDMPDYYSAADLFVLPTVYEGLPKSMLESMSCGVPVISTAVGGIPEVIDSRTGIIT